MHQIYSGSTNSTQIGQKQYPKGQNDPNPDRTYAKFSTLRILSIHHASNNSGSTNTTLVEQKQYPK